MLAGGILVHCSARIRGFSVSSNKFHGYRFGRAFSWISSRYHNYIQYSIYQSPLGYPKHKGLWTYRQIDIFLWKFSRAKGSRVSQMIGLLVKVIANLSNNLDNENRLFVSVVRAYNDQRWISLYRENERYCFEKYASRKTYCCTDKALTIYTGLNCVRKVMPSLNNMM